MKFRSWYLVLLGILLQAGFGIALLFSAETADPWGGLIAAIGGIVLLLASGLGIVPLLLLLFQKTRKAGAVISVILGIVGLSIRVGIIVGVFLVVAGILALWRKI